MRCSVLLARSGLIKLAIVALASCSGGGEGGSSLTQSSPPLEDILTLELSFGSDNVPEDFMLVRPRGLAVDNNGDIMVIDEDYVKVYSSEGKPTALLGGQGEGPGEFNRVSDIWYSPNGYYTVFGGQFGFTAHFFRPDRSYINRVNYMSSRPFLDILAEKNLRPQRPELVFNIGEDERVYSSLDLYLHIQDIF